ncbi:MAG TPA: 5-formyltetrahydrofolate cyclo-ligase [Actinomycetota bacterium]|nr:5-formyltetrahydrofolate cyclo-ligase [Actinomycetota bacterium]
MDDLRRQKDALRARMRGIRSSISPEERIRLSGEIKANVFRLPQVAEAGTILLFYSFGSEVPTTAMIQGLLDSGTRVLLPFVEGPDMDAAELRPGDSLAATTYGPKEPSKRVAVDPAEVDTVIAPGLAFDTYGYRLGYGGGHYDRFLMRLRQGSFRVGIAFHLQLVPSVPHGAGDQPLDFVVTERGTIDCRLNREAG